MNYRKEFENWCNDPVFDEATRAELSALTDEKEIEDRFYKQLSFGTGGLRGIIGAGTNRMNRYTVGRATQGLADFINSHTPCGRAVIAHDSRRMSAEFALDTALILAANGICAYLFDGLRPTPELSYAVRALNATAGIVITASHNPPQYNGYKVYWSDGGQIVPPYDKLIIDRVNAVTDYLSIKRITRKEAEERGLLKIIGSEIDGGYINSVKKLSLNPRAVETCGKTLKIVYTPLNGTGNIPVRRILREMGFENVWVVPEQELPDANFPTLKYPNPEDPAAFTLALKLAEENDADIVLATDPDADRLGVYAKDGEKGGYMPFTGNMSGLLIAEYLLSQRRDKGLLPENPADGAIVTTIVSSDMVFPIAKEYGLTVIRTLTGFKYIGEQMKLFDEAKAANGGKTDGTKGAYEYLFGFEESYGCLAGDHARDKDAVSAVAMLCEAAAYYSLKGKTLPEVMREMYSKYGYYKEDLFGITMSGADGAEKIREICASIRKNPPERIGGRRVLGMWDCLSGIIKTADGEQKPTDLPASNVLYFELENSGWCCVRPSGTEPKIKFYCGAKGESEKEALAELKNITDGIKVFL